MIKIIWNQNWFISNKLKEEWGAERISYLQSPLKD